MCWNILLLKCFSKEIKNYAVNCLNEQMQQPRRYISNWMILINAIFCVLFGIFCVRNDLKGLPYLRDR